MFGRNRICTIIVSIVVILYINWYIQHPPNSYTPEQCAHLLIGFDLHQRYPNVNFHDILRIDCNYWSRDMMLCYCSLFNNTQFQGQLTIHLINTTLCPNFSQHFKFHYRRSFNPAV